MSSKFNKNLEFISDNPEFISDKLSKMSRILSSHIIGMKRIEKEIDNTDFETLKKYTHSLMLVATNLNENLYIINLIVMMFLSDDNFKKKSKKAIENIMTILGTEEHEHDVEEPKEENKEIVEEKPKEEIRVEVSQSEVREESVTEEKQELEAPVKVKKKRGRKKKSELSNIQG